MHDVIIVGARCAGSPLAMLLARHGVKVLLVDRASFPSDIPHGHFIHRHGPRRLRDWGLLDRIAARTPAVTSMLFDAGDFPLVAHNLVEDGLAWGYGPRRTTLDAVLLAAADESGAEVRPCFNVFEYIIEHGKVVGIHGRTPAGQTVLERATLVIGADGRNSGLARAVEAPIYNQVPTLLCYYFSYWSGVAAQEFELYIRTRERRVIFSFRTENDRFAVFVGAPIEEFETFRRDIETAFLQTLDLVPEFAGRVRSGQREERFYGCGDLPNFYRKPYGQGWALIGDAGLHKDPFLALGICDGLRDAEYLAEAIRAGLGGTRPLDEALADFETKRNEASATDYKENIAAARFTPFPPEFLAVRAAVRDKPGDATTLVKARMRMIEPSSFFNPNNMQRLLALAP
ncbi:MAG TPA: NAD(P)/FAD-dependent oxidoreductase [Vicinamibacterales bacterium]|nr:NAD(P)/FAD-dependent oxidoreductase [Vicinamibacterales bacterium]